MLYWIKLGGIYFMLFGLFHLGFWRLFGWRWELRKLSNVNRGIVQTLNVCLSFFFFLMAWVFFFHAEDLVQSQLGHVLLGASALFWFLRMLLQWLWFPKNDLTSQLFALFFLAGAVIFALPLYQSLQQAA